MPANPKLTGPLCWLTGTLWSPLWPPLRYCDFWGWLKPLTLFPVFGYSPKPKGYSFRLKVNLKVHCPKSPSPAGPLPAAPSPQPWGEAESRAQCLLPHGWEELGQGCLGCWVSSILPFLLCVYGDQLSTTQPVSGRAKYPNAGGGCSCPTGVLPGNLFVGLNTPPWLCESLVTLYLSSKLFSSVILAFK